MLNQFVEKLPYILRQFAKKQQEFIMLRTFSRGSVLPKYRVNAVITAIVVLVQMLNLGEAYSQQLPAPVVLAMASSSEAKDALDSGTTSVAQFDSSILRQRGLDPSINAYFRHAARFIPGPNVVSVTVNGTLLGRKSALFNSDGLLCFSAAFVQNVGLKPITNAQDKAMDESLPGSCLQYSDFSPRTVVTLQPSLSAVDIVTPSDFLMPLRAVSTEHGGTGALLNYRAFTLDSRFDGMGSTTFRQLDTTVGFNSGDWLFRSQQSYSGQQGSTGNTSRLRWQGIYAQKTYDDQRQVLQAGRSQTQSPLYGGIAFTGAQWFPERALTPSNTFAVTGVANSRARVEVSQNGALLYSTVVPPGPFNVNNFPLSNRSSDLQVKVIEENGAQQNFVVPASTLLLAADNTVAEGLSVSAGQLWDVTDGSSLKQAPMLTASQGWNYGGRVSGTAGGLASTSYLSAGAGLRANLWDVNQSVYLQALASKDSEHALSGVQGSAAAAFSPSADFQYGFSGNLRSRGYRSVQEAKSIGLALGDPGGYNAQMGGSVRWNTGKAGSLSASLTRQTYFSGEPSYVYSLGWNISLLKAQLAFGLAHNTARNLPAVSNTIGAIQQASSNYLFANLSIPLGHEATSSSFVRRSTESGHDVSRIGTGIDQKINDYFGYRATVEDVVNQSNSANTNLSAYVMPKYTTLALGVGQAQNSHSYYAEASGGVILHPEGVAFTPVAVQDTFGVVKLDGVSGVRLDTPQGPVWSGLNGLAGVPSCRR